MLNRRKLLIRFLIFMGLAMVIYLLPQLLLKGAISKFLSEKIENFSKSGIDITYDHFDFNFFSGRIALYGVQYDVREYSDSSKYGSIEKLELRGLRVGKLLKEKKLFASDFVLEHPIINTIVVDNIQQELRSEKLEQKLAEVHFKELKITDAQWIRRNQDKSIKVNTYLGRASMTDFHLTGLNTDRFKVEFKEINTRNYTMDFLQASYSLRIPQVSYHYSTQRLLCDSIIMSPEESKQDFSRNRGQELDRINASVSNIDIKKFNLDLSTPMAFKGSSLSLNFFFQSYRDKSQPYMKTQRSMLPAEIFDSIPFKFSFDTLQILDSYAEYEERMKADRAPGLVYFNIDTVRAYKVKNTPSRSRIPFFVRARIMGSGDIRMNFDIPSEARDSYALNATVDTFDLSKINSILKSGTLMEFTSGRLNHLELRMKYNDVGSQGSMSMSVDSLAVDVYKSKNANKRSWVKTFILRKVLEDKIKTPHEISADMNFQRVQTRSVFNLWWKTLLAGLKNALQLEPENLNKKD